MKYIITLSIVLMSIVGCDEPPKTAIEKEKRQMEQQYNVHTIVYDSCEYVIISDDPAGYSITHKGNCKFCEQRKNKISDIVYDENNEWDTEALSKANIQTGDIMTKPAKDGSYLIIKKDSTMKEDIIITVKCSPSEDRRTFQYTLMDLGMKKDYWDTLTDEQKLGFIQDAVYQENEQPYWAIDSYEIKPHP